MRVFTYLFTLISTIVHVISQAKEQQELDKIIQEAIKNNPKTQPELLPLLPKVLTKTGLICNFPFYFDEKTYYEKCVLIKGGKKICNVVIDPKTVGKEILDKLLTFENKYFDECLSIDETEKYLNDLVDKNFDFKKKLLIDLYSDIKRTISGTKNSKLIILFELAENYCKNKSFDYSCLYKWIIEPISKTSALSGISKEILKLMDKYKKILDKFIKESITKKFKEQEYKFIIKENLSFSNIADMRSAVDEGGTRNMSGDLILLENSQIDLPHYFRILTLVGANCIEECKAALEFLLTDNFSENIDRMMMETVAYLFKLENLHNIDEKIRFNSTHIKYNKNLYPINSQSRLLIDYKKWHLRYFLFIVYRYLLIERPFFSEIIEGNLSDEQLNTFLFRPKDEELEDQQLLTVSRFLPLTFPYIDFTTKVHDNIITMYRYFTSIGQEIKNNLEKDLDLRTKLLKIIENMTSKLNKKLLFFNKTALPLLSKIAKIKSIIRKIDQNLGLTQSEDTIYSKVKMEALNNNILYTNNLLYSSDSFSQDCHKFLHYNSYFDKTAFGKPNTGYIFMGFEPYFFAEFGEDTKLYFIYGLLLFEKFPGKLYFIKITTNSDVELFINDKQQFPYRRAVSPKSYFYKKAVNSYYMIESPNMLKAYMNLKIKGEFRKDTMVEKDKKLLIFNMTDQFSKDGAPFQEEKYQKKIDQYNKQNLAKDHKNITKKCGSSFISEAICFDYHSFRMNSDMACKNLASKFSSNFQQKKNVKDSERLYNGEDKTKKGKKSKKSNSKAILNEMLNLCNNYALSMEWDIPTYKCLLRNINQDPLDSLLTKCNALNNWKLVARNQEVNAWHKGTNIISGKDNYFDSSDSESSSGNGSNDVLKYIQYSVPTVFSPVAEFNLAISTNLNEFNEYMFATGDFYFWTILDKYQFAKKGTPFIGHSVKNYKMYHSSFSNDTSVFKTTVFKRIFSGEAPEDPLIFLNNYNYTKDLNTKDTDHLIFAQNSYVSNKYMLSRKGVNVFVKKRAYCLKQFFYASNFPSNEYYVEESTLHPMTYIFTDASRLIFKVPKLLDSNAVFLRTKIYQTKYSLSILKKTRIYIALEINEDTEVNGSKLLQQGWVFLDGTENIIEVVNADIGEQVKNLGEFAFYECIFVQKNSPICEKEVIENMNTLKMNLFYKDASQEVVNIEFDFFDYDNFNAALHLLVLQPLECKMEDNHVHTYNHKINNYIRKVIDALPTYSASKKVYRLAGKDVNSTIHNETVNRTASNKLAFLEVNNTITMKSEDKVCKNDKTKLSFLEKPKKKKGKKKKKKWVKTQNESRSDFKINKKPKKKKLIYYNAIQFTSPKLRVNQNGCLFALDRFGNLFFKSFKNFKKSDFGSINKINLEAIEYGWRYIRQKVVDFDLTEDLLIIRDISSEIYVHNAIYQYGECRIKDKWQKITKNIKLKISKMSLNSFGCLWLVDESNRLYYSNDINFYSPQIEAELNQVKHSLFSAIKDIYVANERLYLITRENKIYVKERIFDITTLKCNAGDDMIYKEGLSVSSEVDAFHRIRENYNNNIYALDRRGRVLYRKEKNEFNPDGTDWIELEIYKDVKDDIDRINDIYVDNKDLYLMDSNGVVICYEDINRPRLSDI